MLDTTGIKNIIFDLGGVILNIDYQKTSEAFKKAGMDNFDEVYSQAKQNSLFDDLEIGKISADNFREQVRSYAEHLDDETINNAWNAMLLDLPKYRVDLLQSLKDEFNIYLLSNTNEIHIEAFMNILSQNYPEDLFDQIFKNHYFSSQIGLRKPDVACFEYVLKNNNLEPSETLFIDDSIQHVEGAEKAGLKTVYLRKGMDIIDLFPDRVQPIRH